MIDKKKVAEDIFKKNSIKITPQRVTIFKLLQGNSSHPTAKKLYEEVKNKIPSISFDTVFRTLKLFTETGIVHIASSNTGIKRYDPNTKNHHHFECIRCGDIIDITDNTIDLNTIISSTNRKHQVLNCKLVMTGLCSQCQ